MNYVVSLSEERHYKGLHRVIDVVARERKYLSFTQAPPWEQSAAFYQSLASVDFPHFVALDRDEVVGWIDIAPQFGNSRSHIGTLGIGLLPKARNQGVGTKLLKSAIEKAWAKELTRIELTVRSDNLNAKALYQRFGFQVEGTLRRGSRIDGEYFDVHVMGLLR
jgi:RimJ/RimL family protein N-acetyltransferase